MEKEHSDAVNTSTVSREELEHFYERLKAVQEKKGYFFNKDTTLVLAILEQLLLLKKEYSYMPCPCRLASGDRELDRDIICPCEYREEDLKEYGACYCGLYVTEAWNKGEIEECYVPERRPAEKNIF